MAKSGQDEALCKALSEAAFDCSKWRDVCDEFARLSGSDGSVIVPLATELRGANLPHSASLDTLVDIYQHDKWYLRDVRELGLPKVYKQGFMLDEDCIDYYAIDRSGYFQEFLRPSGMKWFAGIGFGEGPTFCIMSLQRTAARNPFTRAEMQPVLRHKPLVDSSIAIARHLGFERLRSLDAVLSHQQRAILALSAGGRITYVSKRAEAYLGEAFNIKNGWISAFDNRETNCLSALIARQLAPEITPEAGHPICISRRSGKRPIVIYGCRLPEAELEILSPGRALLVIVDPEQQPAAAPPVLTAGFGLTPAEIRLAQAVLNGKSLENHANENLISIATARNHLKSIEAKTSTHSLAELASLLGRFVPY